MDNIVNPDLISYDYANPIREFESLYGRQSEWAAVKQILRRPDAGLNLVIGGARSGKSSLFQVVDDQYKKGIKGQAVELLPPALTFYCSLKQELANLEAGESGSGYAVGPAGVIPFDQATLHKLMFDTFDKDELSTLAFDMNIQPDELDQSVRDKLVTQLISYLDRRGRIRALVDRLGTLRPHVDWQVVFGISQTGATPAAAQRLRLSQLCEKLVRGLRENARAVLEVCSIEWHELTFSPVYTPKEYLQQNVRKVREACLAKLPAPNFKLVLLMDDADVLLAQPWRFEFLDAIHQVFGANVVPILAGGQSLYTTARRDPAWRNLVQRQIPLNNLSPEAIRVLAEKPRGGQSLPDAFLAGVYKQTGGHPYLTQFFLNNVESREALVANPEPDRIARSGRELVSQDETLPRLFAEWSDDCGEVGRWVYRLVLEAGGQLAWNEIVQKMVGLIQATQLEPILNWLCCQGIVVKPTGGTYSVAGELFAEWFRANILPAQQPPQPARGGPDTNIFGPGSVK